MRTHRIKTSSGNQLVFTLYGALESDKIIIIASATGVKQTFYQAFSKYLSNHGTSVITFDYHGIGQSLMIPITLIKTNAEYWGSDNLESIIDYVKETWPNKKIIIIGHSIGGQLIGLAPSSTFAQKIILVGAQSGYWKFWPSSQKIKMWAIWYILFPALIKIFGYMPSRKFSRMENLPKGVAEQWRKWCISSNYLFDDDSIDKQYFGEIKSSIISYSVGDDPFAPKSAVDWMSSTYTNATIKRIHLIPRELGVKKIGHFGFFNERLKEPLWKSLLNNLKD